MRLVSADTQVASGLDRRHRDDDIRARRWGGSLQLIEGRLAVLDELHISLGGFARLHLRRPGPPGGSVGVGQFRQDQPKPLAIWRYGDCVPRHD